MCARGCREGQAADARRGRREVAIGVTRATTMRTRLDQITAAAGMLAMLAAGCTNMSEAQQHESDPARALIDRLADRADAARQREAARELVASGVAAIPALIGALRDPRAYERRDVVNRTNLPGFLPEPKPRYATLTVGQRCEDLLYEIIVPPGSSPPTRFKVFSTQILKVDDWPAWWAANRAKSLVEIHEELTPLVDEYWRRHGTTQRVPTG